MKMGVEGKDIFQIFRRDVIMLKRIHMRKELLNSMCNLSQGIKERALEQGLEQGLAQGRELEVFSSVQACDYDIARGAQKLNLRSLRRKWLLRDIVYRSKTKYVFDG